MSSTTPTNAGGFTGDPAEASASADCCGSSAQEPGVASEAGRCG